MHSSASFLCDLMSDEMRPVIKNEIEQGYVRKNSREIEKKVYRFSRCIKPGEKEHVSSGLERDSTKIDISNSIH